MDAVIGQAIVFSIFSIFFILVLIEDRIKKHWNLMQFLEICGLAFMGAAILFFTTQILHSPLTPVLVRVSEGGVHSVNMIFFCFTFYIFYFIPRKYDLFRASILVLYLITLHEGLWNIFYYGLVRPELLHLFFTYSSPTISIMVFTLIVSIKKYWSIIRLPTILTLMSGVIYGLIWLSMGFPITVGTFETPCPTVLFLDPFTNMIEVGYVINFLSTFVASYYMVNRY